VRRTTKEKKPKISEHAAPDEVVRLLLSDAGLTQSELAELVGVDERSIRRWASDDETTTIQTKPARAIDDLRYLYAVLSPSLPDEEFGQWLRSRNKRLAGQRPVTMILENKYNEVKDAAEAFADAL
jgi:transcriptional regulator with XRE-family HTH domain